MANMTLRRRTAMRGAGSSVDWESIARGMLDLTTQFEIPSDMPVTPATYILAGRSNLKAVTLANSAIINANAFDGCSGLTEIAIPSGYTMISNYAFRGCTGLTTITLPSTMGTIAYRCFQGCTSLAEVIIERTTPPVLQQPWFGCTALTAIYVPDASVEAYKSASSWSEYANLVKGISERPTT